MRFFPKTLVLSSILGACVKETLPFGSSLHPPPDTFLDPPSRHSLQSSLQGRFQAVLGCRCLSERAELPQRGQRPSARMVLRGSALLLPGTE